MPAVSNPSDTVGAILRFIVVMILTPVIIATMTSIGVVGFVTVYTIVWFFGSHRLSFWLTGTVVAATAWWAWPDLSGFKIWQLLLDYYKAAWATPDRFNTVITVWLHPPASPTQTMFLATFGCVVGTWRILSAVDRENVAKALLNGDLAALSRRTPVALLSAWLIARLPNRVGRFTCIGSDYCSGWPVCVTDGAWSKHGMAVGTTGAGKTECGLAVVESAIRAGHPVIYVDGKGDAKIAARLRAFAEKKGRRFYLFNANNVADSDVYNSLAGGNFTSKADRIMAIRNEWTEPHYETLCLGFVQTSFKVLDCVGIQPDLRQLTTYMSTASLLALLRRKGHRGEERQALAREVEGQMEAEKTAISGLKAEISNIANSALGPLFGVTNAARNGHTVFNLEQARAEGAVVFFSLPGLKYPKTAGNIARLVLNDVKATAGTSQKPLLVVLEERSVYPGPQAGHLLSMGRSSGIQVLNLVQSFSDFRFASTDAETAVEQTIASTNTFVCFQLNSDVDAERAARLAGSIMKKEFTAQTVSATPTGASSSRAVYEFSHHPEVIRNLEVGTAIVIDKNRREVRKVAIRRSRL